MDDPICLSQYFVNKQNIRSFKNIIKTKILKSDNQEHFLNFCFEDSSVVSEIIPEFSELMFVIREKLRVESKDDFKKYFPKTLKVNSSLQSVEKEFIFGCCMSALNKIIPHKIFGSNHNAKIFRNIVKSTVYSMRRENLYLGKMLKNWDFSVTPWNFIMAETCRSVLHKIMIWILRYILSLFISLNFYVTTCKLDANEYKLYYFWKNEWQSFYDKCVAKMIFSRKLKRFDSYSMGKQTKKKRSIQEKIKFKTLKKDIPKLHIVLKPNNGFRPIVQYKKEDKSSKKEKLYFLRTLAGKPHKKLECQYDTLYKNWINNNKPQLYFVKTDLSDAFGSVNRNKLLKIISEKHMLWQKQEKNLYLKKKMAQQYQNMVTELRRPLLARCGSVIYEWTEGLIQGYKYSPALSELYYSYLDETYFSHVLADKSESVLFVRVVDDYLYITDSLENAKMFLSALSHYKNVNYEKTVVNFELENIKFSEEITFLGYKYNTKTLEVGKASSVFQGEMCYKINFSSAITNIIKFLENRIGQSGVPINGHIFNLYYNQEVTIWNHIFVTYCLSANKFCTILAILGNGADMVQYLAQYKKRVVVKLTNAILESLMRNKPPNYLFVYCINHFRYLSYKALQLCAKSTPKCNNLLPFINDEIVKCNCLFGKWREHASQINNTGEVLHKSIKEVCRRTDLRVIVKRFETLPVGFKCFNQNSLN